jgi:hypothetical protein
VQRHDQSKDESAQRHDSAKSEVEHPLHHLGAPPLQLGVQFGKLSTELSPKLGNSLVDFGIQLREPSIEVSSELSHWSSPRFADG